MNKTTYESMTRKELRDYLRQNRTDNEAWNVFFEKLNSVQNKKPLPDFNTLEELEQVIADNSELKTKFDPQT